MILPFKRPPGRLLDVGCSIGTMLQTAADDGWTAVGIDVATWAVSYARSRGLEAYLGPLEEAQFAPHSFDVIVLNHVLEHVLDPRSTLEACHRFLRPDGVVFVGAPNFGSWMARIEREHWPALQPEEHVWQFSPRTMGALLRRSGLAVLKVETGMLPRNYTRRPKDLVKRALFALGARTNNAEIMNVIAAPSRPAVRG